MFTHPDLLWTQSKQHQTDLIAEADRYRLLSAARRARRARRGHGDPAVKAVVRGQPAGNLAAGGPQTASAH